MLLLAFGELLHVDELGVCLIHLHFRNLFLKFFFCVAHHLLLFLEQCLLLEVLVEVVDDRLRGLVVLLGNDRLKHLLLSYYAVPKRVELGVTVCYHLVG